MANGHSHVQAREAPGKGAVMGDKVYKCVDFTGDDEIISMRSRGYAQVVYKIGEFVEAPGWLAAKGYHLLVFDNLYDAEQMQTTIFWAEAEEKVALPIRMISEELKHGHISQTHLPWPRGTKMYKRVKLIQEIW